MSYFSDQATSKYNDVYCHIDFHWSVYESGVLRSYVFCLPSTAMRCMHTVTHIHSFATHILFITWCYLAKKVCSCPFQWQLDSNRHSNFRSTLNQLRLLTRCLYAPFPHAHTLVKYLLLPIVLTNCTMYSLKCHLAASFEVYFEKCIHFVFHILV